MKLIRYLLLYLVIYILPLTNLHATVPTWTGAFQVKEPTFIAIDNNQDIYVTNDYINIFDKNYSPKHQIRTIGSSDNQFNKPRKIAIDPATNMLYVVDTLNNRIQTVNTTNYYIEPFGSNDSEGRLYRPSSIMFTKHGIYIADYANNLIKILDKNHTHIEQFGSAGNKNGQFYQPWDIAHKDSKEIYVGDYGNNRVQVFDSQGNFLKSIGHEGDQEGEFQYVHGIALDGNNNLYVVDYGNNRIQIFNPEGNYLEQLGSRGIKKMGFRNPFGIAISKTGLFYVADHSNNRVVLLFDPKAWIEPGEVTIGNLSLNQDLKLKEGYHLNVKKLAGDVTIANHPTESDGKLTIESGGSLTSEIGSSMHASEIELAGGKLAFNQIMDLSIPLTLSAPSNEISVGQASVVTLGKVSSERSNILLKTGTGNLIVGSEFNHKGNTDIREGSFTLNNAKLLGSVQIQAGGELKGIGEITGNIDNLGKISPGLPLGVLKVSGDYHQGIGGSLSSTISVVSNPVAGVDNSFLSISGKTTIEGSKLLITALDGHYEDEAKYTLLEAEGGIEGEFGEHILDIVGPYTGSLLYGENKVSLLLKKTDLVDLIEVSNENSDFNTSTNYKLASYIDSIVDEADYDLDIVIGDLHNMNSREALDKTLDSISPHRNLVANYVSHDVGSWVNSIVHSRLDTAHYIEDENITEPVSFSYNNHTGIKLTNRTKTGLTMGIGELLCSNTLDSSKHQIWFTPFGYLVDQDTDNNRYGYDAKTGGIVVGYDTKYTKDIILGGSLGYYESKIDYKNSIKNDNKIKGLFGTLYGKKEWENKVDDYYVKGSIYIGYNRNNLKRYIELNKEEDYIAESNYASYSLNPRIELGYNYRFCNNTVITPYVASEYGMLFAKGYTEKGAGALNMRVKGGKYQEWSNEIGAKISKKYKLTNEITEALEELYITGKLSYINKKPIKKYDRIRANFVGILGDYISNNDVNVRNEISPSLLVEWHKSNGLIFGAGYSGKFSKKYHAHEAIFKIALYF
ncbi:NHL repeat-containing outer membrane protein [Rickettsiales bacterium Ac37b]|nr:NHL repeat-containing outer membrane protein [Rickettsiales bacterium Ac37b]